ncbi:MAG: hypothetical protein JWQ04_3067, partial [Pedosphaera sp.]|nr:hypothetical protein [Pedosphaera sp.]
MNAFSLLLRTAPLAFALAGCLSAQANDAGYALSFSGAGNYVSVGTTGSVTGVFTVECWANPGDPGAAIGMIGSRKPADNSFDMKFYQGNKVQADIGDGSAWLITSAAAPLPYTVGVWYHVACVVTHTNCTIFINGVQAGGGSYAPGTPVLFD